MKRPALNVFSGDPTRVRRHAALVGVVLSAAASLMHAAAAAAAAPATPFAAPTHDALPSTAGGLLRVMVALIFVVAAIFTAAWLSRRMRGMGGARSASLDILAQLPLGPRERAVLIRVGQRQLLIGVATGCIRTLHVLEPEATAAMAAAAAAMGQDAGAPGQGIEAMPQRPSFKALLLKSLGK